jgi:hypothetical protein
VLGKQEYHSQSPVVKSQLQRRFFGLDPSIASRGGPRLFDSIRKNSKKYVCQVTQFTASREAAGSFLRAQPRGNYKPQPI